MGLSSASGVVLVDGVYLRVILVLSLGIFPSRFHFVIKTPGTMIVGPLALIQLYEATSWTIVILALVDMISSALNSLCRILVITGPSGGDGVLGISGI